MWYFLKVDKGTEYLLEVRRREMHLWIWISLEKSVIEVCSILAQVSGQTDIIYIRSWEYI